MILPFQLNHPDTNYCKKDLPDRVIQRGDVHIIEQICEFYGVKTEEFQCELFITDEEMKQLQAIAEEIAKDEPE